LIASAGILTAALAALALLVQRDPAPPERPLSQLEQEAQARFAGAESYVTYGGKKLPPANAAHALQIKVSAYQRLLAREREQADPTFHLKAEAELERRHPLQAAVEWTDVTGNREMDFYVEDSTKCGLESQTELTVNVEAIGRYPCLTQGGNFWEPRTELKVHLTPITREDRLWSELLDSTKKAMATAAHLAEAGPSKGA
jgi:hypothetical protein